MLTVGPRPTPTDSEAGDRPADEPFDDGGRQGAARLIERRQPEECGSGRNDAAEPQDDEPAETTQHQGRRPRREMIHRIC